MGMGGVQRAMKFSKYLKNFGWQPTVITDSPKKYLAVDKSLLNEAIENGVSIERTGSEDFNPDSIEVVTPRERLRKLRNSLYSFIFIPDSKIGWKKKALKKVDEIWEKYGGFQVVFATAPPYTDFLIALELKKKYNIPLVIDYRDAWVDSPVLNYYPTSYHKKKNIKLEAEVLRFADVIITVNRRVKEYIVGRYESVDYNDVRIIPNGFDPEDFENAKSLVAHTKDKFRITYSGSFYTRNALFYFRGIKLFFEKYPELRGVVEFCFICTLTYLFMDFIRNSGIQQDIKITGYINHIDCVKYILSSDILFLYISRGENDEAAMPGKIGEYIGSQKNILASVPEGVSKKVLENYGAVKFIDEEPGQVADAVYEFYNLSKSGKLPKPDSETISKFNRVKHTEELAKEFNYLLAID